MSHIKLDVSIAWEFSINKVAYNKAFSRETLHRTADYTVRALTGSAIIGLRRCFKNLINNSWIFFAATGRQIVDSGKWNNSWCLCFIDGSKHHVP